MTKILLILLAVVMTLSAQSAQSILKKNKCNECHEVKKRKKGPSYKKIAKKNLKWHGEKANKKLAKSIREGSKGQYRYYSDTQMKPNKNMSDKEIQIVTDWILEINNKKKKSSVF